MPTMTLTNEQVINLVRQLPLQEKQTALMALAEEARTRQLSRMTFAEAQLRQLCAERGLDWEVMSEDEREQFVDDLLHEDLA